MTTVKITELTDIGANLATSTVVPVVNMAGTPTTQKTNIGNIANIILEGAGVDYPEASVALIAQTVSNAAQPNITSVGTLTTLAVSGNASVNGNITSNGTAYLGNISTTGLASITTLNVGTTANLGAVGNVKITGGTAGQILSTDGAGNLSWTSDTTTYGNSNVVTLLSAFGSNTITTTGNVSGGNVLTSANVIANGVIESGTGFSTGGYLSVDGNTDLHNTIVTGNLSATGNITANNLGNISAINLTGSTSNVLYGNGVFAPASGGGNYGDSNVVSLLSAFGSNTITTTGNVSVGNLSTSGIVKIGNATITEINPIVLGFTDDIYVDGDVLSVRLKSNTGTVALNASNSTADTQWTFNVNGTLNLPQPVGNTSASIQSVYGNTNSFVDFVSNNSANFIFGTTANNNLVFIAGLNQGNHRWVMGYDGNTTVPGNIKFAGDPSAAPSLNDFFSITSAANFAIVTDNANTDQTWTFDDTGNLTLPGNTFAVNYANGAQVSLGGSSSNISNGNSNVSIATSNGNVTIAAVGNTTMTVTGTGANVTGTLSASGNITGGNISTGVVTLTNGAVIKDTAGEAVAFGQGAGANIQGANAVAIGFKAGNDTQGVYAVAVGYNAGNNLQGTSAVAIGAFAGNNAQGDNAMAIGVNAGYTGQGLNAVAIGVGAGYAGQGDKTVAIGLDAGKTDQGENAVAVGENAGLFEQGISAVAIGYNAGNNNQGSYSVAVGLGAGQTNQGNNSIIINATGNILNQTVANTFTVSPVRNDVANIAQVMFYNTTSKEVTYGNTISVAGNITGAYILGNGSGLTSLPIPTVAQDITSNGAMSIMTYDGNLKYVNYATVEPSTGNIAGGNISTTGVVTANTANITTGNITTINSGLLQNGNSNITITSNGNVSIQAAGSNVELVVTSTGANVTGTFNATGNVTGSYLISTHASGNEGGEISLAQPPNGNLSGGITIDAYQNTLRMFEQGGTARGLSIDIANSPAGGGTAIGYRDIPQVAAGNVTLAATDAGKHYYSTTAGNLTLTIPLNSTVPFTTGTAISIVVQAAGNILVNAASGVTLYMAGNSTAANRVVGGYGMATLMKVASDTWFINGAGVA